MTTQLGPAVLRTPCKEPRPERSALDPLDPGERPLGVALSGGGFRATLAGIGALRRLAVVGKLGNLRHVSSVSGGSIANGLLARAWGDLRKAEFTVEAFDDLITNPALELICNNSLSGELKKGFWRALLPKTNRTDLLVDQFDEHLFHDTLIEDLPTGCWFEINAANLTAGTRYRFSRDVVGDYITGSVSAAGSGIHLAQAVALSCAVPGAFATVDMHQPKLPCQDAVGTPALVDGGVYDNLGSDALKVRKEMPRLFCVIVNAGGLFDSSSTLGKVPIAGDLYRSNGVMYQQVSSVRSRMLFDEFQSEEKGTLDGTLFSMRTDMPPDKKLTVDQRKALKAYRSENPEVSTEEKQELAAYKTTFDKLPRSIADRLIARGEWLTGAALTLHWQD
ncbi:MAG: patatin-like phospholipase family protein [Ilumatobacteraceae bacterium]